MSNTQPVQSGRRRDGHEGVLSFSIDDSLLFAFFSDAMGLLS